MPRPRVFISSTYYDLKHLRSSLEAFIERLGYEPILSEKDRIAYMPDQPLDESCYREARNADLFVVIIGGRYGSPTSEERKRRPSAGDKKFHERYDSVTRSEYLNAQKEGIPVYICIDSSVDAEYQTYQKNKNNKKVQYAHVDSVNIFELIEFIKDQQKNNPIKLFSRYSEIEEWLKEQWAGQFRELISKNRNQKEIHDLNQKIYELSETTETLKRYLENIITEGGGNKSGSKILIEKENERLKKALKDSEFLSNSYLQHLHRAHDVSVDALRNALEKSDTLNDFIQTLFGNHIPPCISGGRALAEINKAREVHDLEPYSEEELKAVRDAVDIQRKKAESEGKASQAKSPAKRKSKKRSSNNRIESTESASAASATHP